MIDSFVIFTNEISRYIIPLLLVMIPFYGLVFKKIKVYESFVAGAKDGFNIAIRIIPYLIGEMNNKCIVLSTYKYIQFQADYNSFRSKRLLFGF